MSHVVQTACERRVAGSPSLKAVLMYMAARASDDGSGIWTSKRNIAADLEISQRHVIRCIRELCQRGIVAETGHKECARGFTVLYNVDLNVVETLPSTRGDTMSGVTPRHPTGDTMSSLGVTPCQGWGDTMSPKASLKRPVEAPVIHPSKVGFSAEVEPTSKPNVVAIVATVPPPAEKKQAVAVSAFSPFEAFWSRYPRKVGKGAARKAFEQAARKADPAAIMDGLEVLIAERAGQDPKFTPHPSTWLNQERWLDEAPTPEPSFYDKMDAAIAASTAPTTAHDIKLEKFLNGQSHTSGSQQASDSGDHRLAAGLGNTGGAGDRSGSGAADRADGRGGERADFSGVRPRRFR